MAELQITLKPAVYKMDVRPLLKVVLEAFFGPSVGLVDMITEYIPSPADNAEQKVSFVNLSTGGSSKLILICRSEERILDRRPPILFKL